MSVNAMDLLAAHMLGDYILQTNEEAINKFYDIEYLQSHVIKYMLAFVPVTLLSKRKVSDKICFLLLLYATHLITDSRRWASGEEWAPKPILVDQALHAIQLAILGRILR